MGGETMELVKETIGQSTVLTVIEHERLVAPANKDLQRQLSAATGDGNRRYVLDLHRVTYMDIASLTAIIAFAKIVERAGGQVVITGLHHAVEALFRFTRLHEVLAITATRQQALNLA